VPTPILEKLGIQPLTVEEFRRADGSRITRQKGGALFKLGERIVELMSSSVLKATACC
jgi:hypothetical protein